MTQPSAQRLMLVDDESNVLAALQRVLRALGPHEVESFTDPEAALARAREVPVDLVISDYRMPTMDGITFLEQLTRIRPTVVPIMLSAYQDTETLLAAVNRVHVHSFLTKPWDNLQLLDTVSKALAQHSLHQRVAALQHQVDAQAIIIREQQRALEAQRTRAPSEDETAEGDAG